MKKAIVELEYNQFFKEVYLTYLDSFERYSHVLPGTFQLFDFEGNLERVVIPNIVLFLETLESENLDNYWLIVFKTRDDIHQFKQNLFKNMKAGVLEYHLLNFKIEDKFNEYHY